MTATETTYRVDRAISGNSTHVEYAPLWDGLTEGQVISKYNDNRAHLLDGVRIVGSDGLEYYISAVGLAVCI